VADGGMLAAWSGGKGPAARTRTPRRAQPLDPARRGVAWAHRIKGRGREGRGGGMGIEEGRDR
jgi:hypothetical protein